MALFPAQKRFERTIAVARGEQALADMEEIIKSHGFLVVWHEERPLSGTEAAMLHVQLSFEQKT